MARTVKPKTEHRVALAADGPNRLKKPPHFILGEDQNLRCPPGTDFSPLRSVDRRIQSDQAEEVSLRGAVKVIEPCVVSKRPTGSRCRSPFRVGSRRFHLDAGDPNAPASAASKHQVDTRMLTRRR